MKVRVKAGLPRELERYTIERCCLQAKMMPVRSHAQQEGGYSEDVHDPEDVDDVDDTYETEHNESLQSKNGDAVATDKNKTDNSKETDTNEVTNETDEMNLMTEMLTHTYLVGHSST